MIESAVTIAYLMLAISLVLTLLRLVRGPSTPDRVVALELTSSIVVGTVGVHALDTGQTSYLDVAIVMAITGFMATIGFARYIERRRQR